MKYHMNILKKKPLVTPALQDHHLNTMEKLNLNIINRLQTFLPHSYSEPNIFRHSGNDNSDSFMQNNLLSPSALDEKNLDVNSNLMFNNSRDVDSGKDPLQVRLDFDNNSLTVMPLMPGRSNSLETEDSGFSSCGYGDEKDESNWKLHDSSFESSNNARKYSLSSITRSRSCSLDSTSSDAFDALDFNSKRKLSSSVPSSFPYCDESLKPDKADLTAAVSLDVLKKNNIKARISKRIINNKCQTSSKSALSQGDGILSLTSTTTAENLHSRLKAAPFQCVDVFRHHGLASLVGCICYTLFLVFLLGFFAICCRFFKPLVSKKDLKELREDVMEIRRRRDVARSVSYDR